MVNTKDKRAWYALLMIAGGLTGLHLFMAAHTQLLPEEAYYWTYAKHPALGYFDHPPMVAWTVGLGTRLCGDTELGVRLVNLLLWIGSCFGVFLTGKLWFEERVAIGAALLFAALPIFAFIGFIVTPDGPLVFFWVLTLYAVSRALPTPGWGFWLLAGVGFGGALLSKYYAIMLAPSLLWFLLLSPRYRYWLKRPQPYVAVLLALIVFSPAVIWNAQHHWASFAFQSTRTVAQKGTIPRRLAIFWGMQTGILTPFGLALLGAAAWRAVKRGWLERADNWNFAASFALPLFCLFVAASFKTDVHLNWTAPAFISISLAASAMWVEALDAGGKRRRWWLTGTWVMGLLCLAGVLLVHFSLATGEPARFAYTHANGWRELADSVRALQHEQTARTGQTPFIIGADKYNIAAELGFYLQQPAECVNGYAFGAPGLGYRYWTDLQRFQGRPALIIMLNVKNGKPPEIHPDVRAHFDTLDEPEPLHVEAIGKQWQNDFVVRGYGYKP